MATKERRRRHASRQAAERPARRSRRRSSILITESIDWIDYKDVNLLRRFMSERAKIRARRVTGNSTQQQRRGRHARSASRVRWRCCPTACARSPSAPRAVAATASDRVSAAASVASRRAPRRRPTPSRGVAVDEADGEPDGVDGLEA